MQFRGVLAAVAIVAFAGSGGVAAAPQGGGSVQEREAAQQRDVEALVRLVDAVSAGEQQAPAEVPLRWEANHFIKGQGSETYIPFTVQIDRARLERPTVALYVRAVDKRQAGTPVADGQPPRYAWDNLHFLDLPADGQLSRAIALAPGEYDLFIAVTAASASPDAAPGPTGVLHRDLSVPDYTAGGLLTSSVILARDMEVLAAPVPPDQQEEHPYVFGPMRIVPAPDATFAKHGELQVIFWIYGARAAADGKPDVEVEYLFHHRLADGEKYFNRTEPQALNASTLPPEFSMAAGHQLPGSVVVPLEIFPAGDYRLEIRVQDKVSGESLTRNVNFTVLPG